MELVFEVCYFNTAQRKVTTIVYNVTMILPLLNGECTMYIYVHLFYVSSLTDDRKFHLHSFLHLLAWNDSDCNAIKSLVGR